MTERNLIGEDSALERRGPDTFALGAFERGEEGMACVFGPIFERPPRAARHTDDGAAGRWN